MGLRETKLFEPLGDLVTERLWRKTKKEASDAAP
jgi:hypothetical protein